MIKRFFIQMCRDVSRWIEWISAAVGDIAGVAVLIMTFLVTANVILRFVFHEPTTWIPELSQYLLVGVTFLGLAYTLQEKGHIRVDLVVSKLPKKLQDWFQIATSMAFLFFTALLFRLTLKFAMDSYAFQTTSRTAWDILIWPYQVALPLGYAIISLLLVCNIINEIRIALGKSKGR